MPANLFPRFDATVVMPSTPDDVASLASLCLRTPPVSATPYLATVRVPIDEHEPARPRRPHREHSTDGRTPSSVIGLGAGVRSLPYRHSPKSS